jgi:hypothetical protein
VVLERLLYLAVTLDRHTSSAEKLVIHLQLVNLTKHIGTHNDEKF